VKCKQTVQDGNKKKSKQASIVIDSDTEYENEKGGKENKLVARLDELEYREKDLALKERELALREAKIRVMELSNIEKERQLTLPN